MFSFIFFKRSQVEKYNQKNVAKPQVTNTIEPYLPIFFIPKPDIESSILSFEDNHFQTIWEWLPRRLTITNPMLQYTSKGNGYALSSMLQHVQGIAPSLIVLKTNHNHVC